MREDGMIADKLLITTNPDFTVSGVGPVESPRVGQAVPPSVSSVEPAADAVGVPVNSNIQIVLTDGTNPLNTNSIRLTVNGTLVTPAVTRAGSQTTLIYDPSTDLPSGARVNLELTFADNATPPNTTTFNSSFTTERQAITGAPFEQNTDSLVSI
jgi:hypothetical protein